MSVTLDTTLGPIKLELYCDKAPKTCKNFLGLAAAGKYNGTKFHRVIPTFIMQGGSTSGNGKNDESIYDGPFDDEIVEGLHHERRGVLSMANKGPNTNLSQFFITFGKQSHLNNANTVFGRVIYGWETLDSVEVAQTDAKNRPLNPIVIEQVTIHANPFAEKELQ